MAERTIRIRFSGDATRLIAAAGKAETRLSKFSKVAGRVGKTVAASVAGLTAVSTGAALGIGAALGGVPVLFAAIGIAAVKENAKVKAAFTGLANEVKTGTAEAASSLVPVLTNIAGQLGSTFQGLRPQVTRIFDGVAPMIQTVADGVMAFARNAMPGFVTAVESAKPVIDAISRGLGEFGTALTDFFTNISAGGPAAGQAFTAIFDIANALLPVIGTLLATFAQLAGQLTPILVPAITLVATALQGMATFVQANLTWLLPLAGAIGAVALGIKTVTAAVKLWRAAVVAYTIVQWALNVAMTANPIGLVIAAVVALIALVAVIIAKWKPISAFFKRLWGQVTGAARAAGRWIANAFRNAVNWVRGVWRGITGFFSGIWNNIVGGVRSAVRWVVNAWNGAVNGIRGFFSGLGSFVGGIWGGIVSGVKNVINGAIGVINNLIGGVNNVTSAVGIPGIPYIGYLAEGGVARHGRSYIVGEEGPELFTPGRTGRVTSNDDMAGLAGGSGRPIIVENHIEIGGEVVRVVRTEISENARGTRRRVLAGTGGAR